MGSRPAVDPSQLVALNVLLEEANVTRAARRLGITQSSMSHRLAQLRRSLGDPLFVRVGASLVPTPRALAIAQPLAEALLALTASVAPAPRFDPLSDRSVLGIAMPDLLAPRAPRLVATLVDAAPKLEIRLTNIVPALSTALAADPPGLALTPSRFVEDDIRARSLGELRFGVVGRRDHPALRRKLTTERWLAHAHVTVRLGNERTNVIEEELARRGLVRRIGLEVPSFLAGLLVVARSDFLMNVPMIKSMGANGAPSPAESPWAIIAAADIGRYAARRLRARDFAGFSAVNLVGPRPVSMSETTRVLGRAIGKPELPYVQVGYDDLERGMIGMGLKPRLAAMYVELYRGAAAGLLAPEPGTETVRLDTPLEAFGPVFAAAYAA